MEEKERYINQVFGLKGNYKEYVFDTYLSYKIEFNECYKVLNQQDKRIKELEEENKKANINNYLEDYFLVEKENQQLKQQLAITEKALELAANMQSHCPYLATKKEDGNVIFYIDKTDCDNNCSNCIKNHYKQRAKEMLENE